MARKRRPGLKCGPRGERRPPAKPQACRWGLRKRHSDLSPATSNLQCLPRTQPSGAACRRRLLGAQREAEKGGEWTWEGGQMETLLHMHLVISNNQRIQFCKIPLKRATKE